MEYLVGFNYSGRVTYEIEADDEETAKREAANRWLVWVSADAVGHNPEFACADIKYDTMTAERLNVVEKYIRLIDTADSVDKISEITNRAAWDVSITNQEYCEIYDYAVNKVRDWR